MADQMQRQGPLTHIRILDLGRIMAAPWATQIFADLGADVIKIERPGAGDDTRAWGPPFLSDAEGRATKEAGYFLSVNRGKRSVALDIATAEGQAIVRKLAESADVVIENFKVGRWRSMASTPRRCGRSSRISSTVRSPASVKTVPAPSRRPTTSQYRPWVA